MEEVCDLKDGGEKKIEDSELDKNDTSDPLVYQLVRVEGDGTLVPATADEVMQIEHLLDDEKSDFPLMEDVRIVEGYFSNDGLLSKTCNFEGAAFSEAADTVISSQKVDNNLEDERMLLSDESLDTSKNMCIDDKPPDENNSTRVSGDMLQQDNASTETTPKSTVLNDCQSTEKEKTDACSSMVNKTIAAGTSVTQTSGNSMPNFSLIKGEVCLDKLTIRELQETFKATFGRPTTVKDKTWLKRRIAMGLSNSCYVPTSNFVIKDNKIIIKDGEEEIPWSDRVDKVECSSLPEVQITEPGNDSYRDPSTLSHYQSEDQQGSSKRLRRTPGDYDSRKEVLLEDQYTIKRMRKPTKRYIEELSDGETRESAGRHFSSGKISGNDQSSSKQRVRSSHGLNRWMETFHTRQDIFGGFSVQVPYASRMRRGRPRKDLNSFSNHVESVKMRASMGIAFQDVEKRRQNGKSRSMFGRIPPLKHDKKEADEESTEVVNSDQEEDIELEKHSMPEENSGDDAHACSAMKPGLKRKHHRAWTLCEVLKLVEGVARHGAGRWSEIKRVSFSACSYRTSVDLKDKWRNLIRASLQQLPMERDGGCPRKNNSTTPIPPSILLRVKELAEMQSQTGSDLVVPVKFSGPMRKVVQGKGSGFL